MSILYKSGLRAGTSINHMVKRIKGGHRNFFILIHSLVKQKSNLFNGEMRFES